MNKLKKNAIKQKKFFMINYKKETQIQNRKSLYIFSSKNSHIEAELKEKKYEKIRQTFDIDKNYKPGSAFDFETQEKKRLEKIMMKE